jgi:hypothetical protein
LTLQSLLLRHGALLRAGVLALVLLLSQSLGLLHGIMHAPSAAAGHAAQVVHAVGEVEHGAGRFLDRLFSGHSSEDGDSGCRLYEQSSHCDAMPGVLVLALPLVLTPFVFSVLPGLAVARWHALFQARGPPSVR